METELTGLSSVDYDMEILTYCNLAFTFVPMILRILGKTHAKVILEVPSF